MSPFLAAILLLITVVGCGDSGKSNGASETLYVVTYGGGAYQQSHIDAFLEPFSENGVETESVVWNAEYGRLKEMVKSGNVVWDVVEVTAAHYARGVQDGLFEPLPLEINSDVFVPVDGGPDITEFGAPNVYWSTVLAYDPGDKNPSTWSDFWNTEDYPGARALYDDPRGNLEFALLADGVSLDELYPLDIERAFRKLDDIKPHVRVWWKDGTEPVQLLLTNQVVMTSAWSGRIFASEKAKEQIRYSWSGAAHELDYWVIPKGAKRVDKAGEFIRFASSPKPMAVQATATAYGPANMLALEHVDEATKSYLPTAEKNWEQSFTINSDWWAANEKEVKQRWIKWKNE